VDYSTEGATLQVSTKNSITSRFSYNTYLIILIYCPNGFGAIELTTGFT